MLSDGQHVLDHLGQPVCFDLLGEAGRRATEQGNEERLAALGKLRTAIWPVRYQVESLPDSIGGLP